MTMTWIKDVMIYGSGVLLKHDPDTGLVIPLYDEYWSMEVFVSNLSPKNAGDEPQQSATAAQRSEPQSKLGAVVEDD